MSKFNEITQTTVTTNRAGGKAYDLNTKEKLATLLLTSFLDDQYYRSENDTINELVELTKADPLFAAKASIFARKEYGMRSVSHVVSAIIAETVKGQSWTKNYLANVVKRPDDITETLAFYMKVRGNKLSNSLRKGFGQALSGFDEYQLAKYQGKGKDISLVDAVNILHPKSTTALSKLMKGTLRPADTWETNLTQAGQKATNLKEKETLKSEAWSDLVHSKKLGQFALLRNLRNIIEQADDETFNLALELLVDEKRIKNSLILPFRFWSAYEVVQGMSHSRCAKTLTALEDALDISCDNVPEYDGHSTIVVDTSGSMRGRWLTPKPPIIMASLFAAAMYKKQKEVQVLAFDYNTRSMKMPGQRGSVVSIMQKIKEQCTGGATNFHSVFEYMNSHRIDTRRVFIFSDMQGWVGGHRSGQQSYNVYCKNRGIKPHVYCFDLAGQGTTQFKNGAVLLSGFSEKVFDLLKTTEQDKGALVRTIEQIEL